MSQQAQPVRTGDVYPPSAAGHDEARRERDRAIVQGQEQRDGGLKVTETDLPAGRRMVTASAGGQVMAQFTVPVPGAGVAEATDAVTMGEALQAAAQTAAGGRPVGAAYAAAVQAAEARATGLGGSVPGGVAAAAQRAAAVNATTKEDGRAVTLRDVVGDDAAARLPADKTVTREDAEMVAAAAARNFGKGPRPGKDGVEEVTAAGKGRGRAGVVEAVAAAADMNEGRMA